MAYYENLMAEQPWQYRPAFGDAWYTGEFGDGADPLAAALRSSFSGDSSAEVLESPATIPTASGGSEADFAAPKRRRVADGVPPSGRVSKRKPRGSKRSAKTTFIVADPENFRRMVQQVTGVKLGLGGAADLAPALGEDRIGGVVDLDGGLPTLNSSAFLPEPPVSQPSPVADGGGAAAERLFDSFCSFPTLESWSSWKAV
ncbi:VQ motif-containing protein [Striga hermonthica]|uniref:VQ motif-containing protein n=1 Tax=Striga hermonthica TaxID=68872 RepID=A0A9N7NMW2_STRHE|nr:VQ motif-containing protein [Striga hermonthica]